MGSEAEKRRETPLTHKFRRFGATPHRPSLHLHATGRTVHGTPINQGKPAPEMPREDTPLPYSINIGNSDTSWVSFTEIQVHLHLMKTSFDLAFITCVRNGEMPHQDTAFKPLTCFQTPLPVITAVSHTRGQWNQQQRAEEGWEPSYLARGRLLPPLSSPRPPPPPGRRWLSPPGRTPSRGCWAH